MARYQIKVSLLSFALLALSACGGSGTSSSTAGTGTSQATPGFVCNGPVQELFKAMQGTYDGVVDPAFLSGSRCPTDDWRHLSSQYLWPRLLYPFYWRKRHSNTCLLLVIRVTRYQVPLSALARPRSCKIQMNSI